MTVFKRFHRFLIIPVMTKNTSDIREEKISEKFPILREVSFVADGHYPVVFEHSGYYRSSETLLLRSDQFMRFAPPKEIDDFRSQGA
jgi:hypothetical protein